MNAFYSSPVGQKVLEQLPAVLQEGNAAMLPIISKYLSEWEDRVKGEFDEEDSKHPKGAPATPTQK